MDEWRYEPVQRLPADALAANSWIMNALRDQLYHAIHWVLRVQFRFRIEGAGLLHLSPPYVLIANHCSHLDTVCLLAALPPSRRNRCYSAAAEDYFYTNVFKAQAARLLANTFPFRRYEDTDRSLAACRSILDRGDSLIFYPEGTRSPDGRMQRFRRGIGLLVQGTPYPVIPVYIRGTHDALAKGRRMLRSTTIALRVGEPERFHEAPAGDESAIAIANHLQATVEALAS